ncbi:PA14 domain-containing protein [Sinomicrobium weinanense]|uniref:RICIN domain-containing protein n=1 Tax=Sinomicrobium weinanense TaxID=2842200 RepID=A0A926JT86_9FLAO|nr:PA14 domain-containing protein [Sinomicrobium weinanense]MBC9797100.1 RICIN domain-containing protein [Sinomicrobium weinanense]MBU3124796.1 RICIN domain-containing protein [Sinomicrobium weinanense]
MKKKLLYSLITGVLSFLYTEAQTIPRVEGSPYPFSAVPDRLFLTSENYSPSERVALQTLMGVIAKDKPEILRDIYGHRTLVENAGVIIDDTYYTDFPGLLARFSDRLDGYILCHPKDRSTNAAISLAGVMNAVAIPEDIEQTAIDAGLTRLLDVREKDESWVLANYGDLFSRTIASYQQSSDDRVNHLADYSTYTGAFQFWDDSATGTLADSVYKRMDKGATYFGWGAGEYETVEQLSLHSGVIHPSDWAPNMSALTNIPPVKETFRQKDPVKAFETVPDVHTVCFVISDGDNVQWLLGSHDSPTSWNNPNRARVNLGWTTSPALAELAPIVYEKYVDNTLTTPEGRNVLIAGPSGRGYHLPGRYPDADLEEECSLLNNYMKRADLRIVNIIDADDSDNDPSAYLKQDNIDALFYYSYGANYTGRQGQIDWYNGKPSIGGRYTLWGTLSSPGSLAEQLNQASTDIYSEDGYSLIPVHVWSRGVDDVLECISRLGPNVRVVAPDEFVWLVKKNLGRLPAGTGNGLKAEYYNGYHRDELKYSKTDPTVDFDWATGTPDESLGTDQFSVRWSGQVQPLYDEAYTFYVYSDDGAKLTVNGQVLIDDYETQGGYTRSGTITLAAGEKYDISLEYGEGNGEAFCYLEWESSSQMRETIPRAQLYSRPDVSEGPVTFYEHCDYNGFHAGLPIGQYKLADLELKGFRDDEIASLKIAKGYKVILYEDDNFKGASKTLTVNNGCLGNWKNRTSSVKVVANGETGLGGTYSLKNINSGLFLDVRGGLGGVSDGANAQLWHKNNQANQTFNLKHLGNGVYTITAYHSAKCLDVEQSDYDDNANISQRTNYEALNQQFIAIPVNGRYYKFISVISGKVIAIAGESTAPEANVVQFTDTGQASAVWELISAPPVGNGDGLTGDYYNGMEFDTHVFSRVDPDIDFDWGEGSPGSGVDTDGYSVRWTGKVEPRYSGEYTFYVTSDNGRRLWVNGELIIDKWIDDWDVEYSGTITLEAGQRYDIRLEYFENYGGANCRLRWSNDSQPKEIIPRNQLYSAGRTITVRTENTSGQGTNAILYPNPASGDLRLQFDAQKARMTVYDMSGRMVIPAMAVRPDEPVDISRLKMGQYIVRFHINGKETTKHLIKE